MEKSRHISSGRPVPRILKILGGGLLVLWIGACTTAEEIIKPKEDPYTLQIKEPKAQHSMTLLGSGPFFVSHNPKFGGVQSYQVILRVTLGSSWV